MQSLFVLFCCFSLLPDLDHFLIQKGVYVTPSGTEIIEGYITPKQKEVFVEELKKLSGLKKIAEVGFNAGHTSEIFLEFTHNTQVVSFDINSHYYTKHGVEFLKSKYTDRFQFVEGDSRYTIIDFFKTHPNETFDLIYIDGCHLFEVCLDDILNFKHLAHENSILWIDDTNFSDVKRAVDLAERLHIIRVVKSQSAEDDFGIRAWVDARYIFRPP